MTVILHAPRTGTSSIAGIPGRCYLWPDARLHTPSSMKVGGAPEIRPSGSRVRVGILAAVCMTSRPVYCITNVSTVGGERRGRCTHPPVQRCDRIDVLAGVCEGGWQRRWYLSAISMVLWAENAHESTFPGLPLFQNSRLRLCRCGHGASLRFGGDEGRRPWAGHWRRALYRLAPAPIYSRTDTPAPAPAPAYDQLNQPPHNQLSTCPGPCPSPGLPFRTEQTDVERGTQHGHARPGLRIPASRVSSARPNAQSVAGRMIDRDLITLLTRIALEPDSLWNPNRRAGRSITPRPSPTRTRSRRPTSPPFPRPRRRIHASSSGTVLSSALLESTLIRNHNPRARRRRPSIRSCHPPPSSTPGPDSSLWVLHPSFPATALPPHCLHHHMSRKLYEHVHRPRGALPRQECA